MLAFKSYLSYLLYLVQLCACVVEVEVVGPEEEVERQEGGRVS